MKADTILQLGDPAGILPDPLTEILRNGARDLLAQAIEAEVCDLLARHAHLKDAAGRQRVVRHGYLPEHAVMTGIVDYYNNARDHESLGNVASTDVSFDRDSDIIREREKIKKEAIRKRRLQHQYSGCMINHPNEPELPMFKTI